MRVGCCRLHSKLPADSRARAVQHEQHSAASMRSPPSLPLSNTHPAAMEIITVLPSPSEVSAHKRSLASSRPSCPSSPSAAAVRSIERWHTTRCTNCQKFLWEFSGRRVLYHCCVTNSCEIVTTKALPRMLLRPVRKNTAATHQRGPYGRLVGWAIGISTKHFLESVTI